MKREVEPKKTVQYNLGEKVALITGGASGLGLATARRFLASNAYVVLADYSEKVMEIAEHLGCAGIQMDVTKEEDIKAAVQLAVDTYGSLDILVASAGVGGDNRPIDDETLDNWEKVNRVDYTGVMLSDKYAIMQMRKQGHGGAVINLASMFGLVAVPGVVNLTKAAGTMYAKEGIRVNCVCPGVINTPLVPEDAKEAYRNLHPMHRIGEDFEVAAIITFLASDDARFITAAAIPVDGGYTGV